MSKGGVTWYRCCCCCVNPHSCRDNLLYFSFCFCLSVLASVYIPSFLSSYVAFNFFCFSLIFKPTSCFSLSSFQHFTTILLKLLSLNLYLFLATPTCLYLNMFLALFLSISPSVYLPLSLSILLYIFLSLSRSVSIALFPYYYLFLSVNCFVSLPFCAVPEFRSHPLSRK